MVSSPRLLCALGVLALILSMASRAGAAGDPDLVWRTIETEHFRVHFEKNLQPIAERVAALSESIHQRLTGPLGYTPRERTEVLLTDNTDSANGSATSTPFNAVRLFVTAPDDMSPLGDYDDWYLGLMTHEYTHILHVDNTSGIPAIINAVLGKTYNPNQIQPRWIIEGLATVAESQFTSGGRIRSTLFDMFLRADVIEDNIAGLDQISSNSTRWPQGTLFYLYGSRFLHWIQEVYGPGVMRAVSADYGASLVPWGINRAIRRQTGRTYVELYAGFKDHIRRRYAAQMARVKARGLREGQRITYHGRTVSYPRFVPAAAGAASRYDVIYHRDDMFHRPGFYRIDLAAPEESEELVVRTNGEGPATFTVEGDLVYSSVVPFKRVYPRHDLFTLPRAERAPSGLEQNKRRLTVGARAYAPTASPDGRHLSYVKNERGTSTLMIARFDDEGRLEKRRVLARSGRFDQVFTPAFSPDGSKVAYSSWTAGGFRDIRVVDVKSGAVERITADRAMDTHPAWSADGKRLFFASDRSGISNVYVLDLERRRLEQVTNVRTGAFMPAVSDDGKLLVYAGYTSKGYDLYALEIDPSRFLEAPAPPDDRPEPQAEPAPVAMRTYPYNPLPTLRPHNWSFEYSQGNFGSNAFIARVDGADIAAHHAFAASVVADPEAPGPQGSLEYRYLRLPADLVLRLAHRYAPRRDFRFNDVENLTYTERSYSVVSGVSYTHPGEFANQGFSLSHTLSFFDSALPIASAGPLDPYAAPTVDPFRGMLSVLRAGYSYAMVESSIETAGPTRGFLLTFALDLADKATGSQQSLYSAEYTAQGYLPMPWPGHHVLAVRSGGGWSAGTYARRGLFFVGGYNLENVSLIDNFAGGVFNGAFVLRGYEPGVFSGSKFVLTNLEYRVPLAIIDRGLSTLPLFLRRIDGNLFLDWGGAFNEIDADDVEFFSHGAIVHSPLLHSGAGAELWLGLTLAYAINPQLRLGYAYGFSGQRVPGGQAYFIASTAF
jgi:hypothetical protein